jgi:SAM-dependent methyltransferase
VLGLTGPVGSVRRMDIVNTHQSQAWNGYEGRHWADNHERYNTLVSGLNEPLFEAAEIGQDHRVLDIGCGAGQTTRMAARLASRGHAVGIDLSEPMLERAGLRSPGWRFTAVRRQTGR